MENVARISSYHIGAHPELYEPSRNNAFEFIVNPDLQDRILYPGTDTSIEIPDTAKIPGVQETIAIAVSEASVPQFKIDPIEVRRGNSKVTFAGNPSFSAGSLKLHDYVGARVKDILMGWQALAYDVVNDVVNLAANYKFDCTLIEYTPDFSSIIRQWTLKGCWISEITDENFTQENHEDRSITATIVFDRAIPLVNNI